MTTNDTCPHCGADKHVLGHAYKCGSNENMTSSACYVRQLAVKAEIEQLRSELAAATKARGEA
jgi:hypothetical protein